MLMINKLNLESIAHNSGEVHQGNMTLVQFHEIQYGYYLLCRTVIPHSSAAWAQIMQHAHNLRLALGGNNEADEINFIQNK